MFIQDSELLLGFLGGDNATGHQNAQEGEIETLPSKAMKIKCFLEFLSMN